MADAKHHEYRVQRKQVVVMWPDVLGGLSHAPNMAQLICEEVQRENPHDEFRIMDVTTGEVIWPKKDVPI